MLMLDLFFLPLTMELERTTTNSSTGPSLYAWGGITPNDRIRILNIVHSAIVNAMDLKNLDRNNILFIKIDTKKSPEFRINIQEISYKEIKKYLLEIPDLGKHYLGTLDYMYSKRNDLQDGVTVHAEFKTSFSDIPQHSTFNFCMSDLIDSTRVLGYLEDDEHTKISLSSIKTFIQENKKRITSFIEKNESDDILITYNRETGKCTMDSMDKKDFQIHLAKRFIQVKETHRIAFLVTTFGYRFYGKGMSIATFKKYSI